MAFKMSNNPYLHSIITSIRTVIIILLITFSLLELALRVYNYFNPLMIFYDNSYNRFRGKPFANDFGFKLNSLGFKDVEFSHEKGQAYRILGLGDSFAFGVVPYDNNYLTLLESGLQQKPANVEVFNMGIPSTGPKEYLSLLVREGLDYHPDMVLVSLFVGNDFLENIKARKWYTYSYVTSFFHYAIALQRKYEHHAIHGEAQYCDDCANFTEDAYIKLEQERSFIFVPESPLFHLALDRVVEALAKIQEICNKNGIKLVVLIIPDEVQINPQLQSEVRQQLATEGKGWNTTQPNEKLAEKIKAMNIDYLDLYPYFSEEAHKRQLYRPRDTHWNIAGNQFAATIIKNHILHYLPFN